MQAVSSVIQTSPRFHPSEIASLIGIYPGAAAHWIRRLNSRYNLFDYYRGQTSLYTPNELGSAVLNLFGSVQEEQ